MQVESDNTMEQGTGVAIEGEVAIKRKKPWQTRKKGGLAKVKRKQLIFCIVMAAIPLAQFILFYICVNVNVILLAFQRTGIGGVTEWGGFNFANLFRKFSTEIVFKYALKNSLVSFVFTTVLQIPLALLFSYYIFKKSAMGGLFKIMLFLPSVVTSIVLVMVYMYFLDDAIPAIIKAIFGKEIVGLYSNFDTRFGSVLFYSVVMSFGPNVLMFLSSMKSVNESVLEAARLDGAKYFQEFFYIVLPMCYPTVVTFFIIGISGIFTNQLNLVSFMGTEEPLPSMQTFGYYMFQQTAKYGNSVYPELSALGLLITVVVVPLTFLTKWLLEKFGPRTEM